MKIHESGYGDGSNNFHIGKRGDELSIDLTYPPYTDADNKIGKCRYVRVDQESVRASDGVRLHYDYDRDGFVIEQPKSRLVKTGEDSYETVTDWIEVAFAQSWKFASVGEDGSLDPGQAEYEAADAEFDKTRGR